MRAFTYERPVDMAAALVAIGRPGAKFLAGGTNLLDLMKIEAETPQHLVDVSRLPLDQIGEENGGLRIGAMVTNTALAGDSRVREHYPLQALLYSVALHRYLRWRQPGYDPARHLGGVLYLFVRGMCGADTPVVDGNPAGVFSWRPPASLVIALSDLLDAGGRRHDDG